jgi:hypothetical protein
MKRPITLLGWLTLLLALPVACSDSTEAALKDNPLCKFDCGKRGLAEGSSAISGVSTADTLFEAVVGYSTAADYVSAALEAELAQLRADFGLTKDATIGAEIRRQGADVLGASPNIVAAEALCWVDAQRLIEIQGQCDAELEKGDTITCKGACRVEAGTDCGLLATLECTQSANGVLPDPDAGMPSPISGVCADFCNGTCTDAPDPSGRCDGVCLGSCDEMCDRFGPSQGGGEAACAGRCSGHCDGQCVRVVERATCRGVCAGTCTTEDPKDGCDGAIETRCQPNMGRAFQCPGACGGVFEAPAGNAECRAAAQALASYVARCDAPRVSVQRRPAPAEPDAREQRYLFGLRNLELRFPELLANIARAKLIKGAGQGFAIDSAKVQDSLRNESEAETVSIQDGAGLSCASAEAPRVDKALEPAQRRLDGVLSQANELLGAFDIQN